MNIEKDSASDFGKDGSGFARLPNHGVIQLTGDDRHSFLNSFCTADLKKLPAMSVSEAFVLNEKGKCLLFTNVIALEDRMLLVFNDKNVASQVLAHLDKYLIREDVELNDCSNESGVWFAAGPETGRRLFESEMANESKDVSISNDAVAMVVAKAEVAGNGWLVVADKAAIETVESKLEQAGIQKSNGEALSLLRMEAVTPWNGIEVTLDNLPQEIERNEKAISFTKGCYLGQETVARLDALGRVNWLLRGLRSEMKLEADGPVSVELDGKKIARITSIAWSEREQCSLAIGFVKRGFEKSGTALGEWLVRDVSGG
jgi:folate-binding protein YgfZ